MSGAPLLAGIVGHELHGAGLRLVGIDHRLRDPRHVRQQRLDLAELDAVAADLHLRVDAAEEIELAVLADAAEVAGAIDVLRRIVGDVQEVGNELLRR